MKLGQADIDYAVLLFRSGWSYTDIANDLSAKGVEVTRQTISGYIREVVPAAERRQIKRLRYVKAEDIWESALIYFFWTMGHKPRHIRPTLKAMMPKRRLSLQMIGKKIKQFEDGYCYDFSEADIQFVKRAILSQELLLDVAKRDPIVMAAMGKIAKKSDDEWYDEVYKKGNTFLGKQDKQRRESVVPDFLRTGG